jgi:hypothetical protein
MQRIAAGDGDGGYVTEAEPIAGPVGDDRSITISNTGRVGLLQLGPDGQPDSFTYTPRQAYAVQGCWNCGTKNLP